jgi:hypothetical protein
MITDRQGILHGTRRYFERLHYETPYNERKNKRPNDGFYKITDYGFFLKCCLIQFNGIG